MDDSITEAKQLQISIEKMSGEPSIKNISSMTKLEESKNLQHQHEVMEGAGGGLIQHTLQESGSALQVTAMKK